MSAATLAPAPTVVTERVAPPLAEWEQDVLRKLRLLRQSGKPAILFVTDAGAILVFRGEQAGRIAP